MSDWGYILNWCSRPTSLVGPERLNNWPFVITDEDGTEYLCSTNGAVFAWCPYDNQCPIDKTFLSRHVVNKRGPLEWILKSKQCKFTRPDFLDWDESIISEWLDDDNFARHGGECYSVGILELNPTITVVSQVTIEVDGCGKVNALVLKWGDNGTAITMPMKLERGDDE